MARTPICFEDLNTMPFEDMLERATQSMKELYAMSYVDAFGSDPAAMEGNPGILLADLTACIHRIEKQHRQPHFTEEQWEFMLDVINAVHLESKWLFRDCKEKDPEVLRIQIARWERIRIAIDNCLQRFAKGFPKVEPNEASEAVERLLRANAEAIARDKEKMAFKMPPAIAVVNKVRVTPTSVTVGVDHPFPVPPPRPTPQELAQQAEAKAVEAAAAPPARPAA